MQRLIGYVAKRAGVTVQAVRYYERFGILRPARRTPGGYRVYSPETVSVLRYTRIAQKRGAKLKDIKVFLECLRAGTDNCHRLLKVVTKRKEEYLREARILRVRLKAVTAHHRLISRCLPRQCGNKDRTITCPLVFDVSGIRATCTNGILKFPRNTPLT